MEGEIRLRPQHGRVFLCDKRFIVLVAGRKWGKTMLALLWLISEAMRKQNQTCYYVAPTYRQAKRIAWRRLKQLLSPSMRRCTREDELEIELRNGSIIQLHGVSRFDSLRGTWLDATVLDEYAMMDAEAWEAVIRPMLSDRMGQALFIGTPKGHNQLYDLYLAAQSGRDWGAFRFPTREGGYVPFAELEALRCDMDPMLYRQEYEASFEALQGRVYYAFCREANVTDVVLLPDAPLLIGMDFNVNPMTAVVAQKAGDQCQVIDEIVLPNSNTQEMMEEINRRFRGRRGVVHPDPTGVARKTSAPVGQNDFAIIEQAGWLVYKGKLTPIPDRITNVNTMLCNARGDRRLLISPKCKHLIRALDTLTRKENTNLPDKSTGQDHITDALGYLVVNVFPMVRSGGVTITQVLL